MTWPTHLALTSPRCPLWAKVSSDKAQWEFGAEEAVCTCVNDGMCLCRLRLAGVTSGSCGSGHVTPSTAVGFSPLRPSVVCFWIVTLPGCRVWMWLFWPVDCACCCIESLQVSPRSPGKPAWSGSAGSVRFPQCYWGDSVSQIGSKDCSDIFLLNWPLLPSSVCPHVAVIYKYTVHWTFFFIIF